MLSTKCPMTLLIYVAPGLQKNPTSQVYLYGRCLEIGTLNAREDGKNVRNARLGF